MNSDRFRWSATALLLFALATPAWAINNSVPGIHGDVSRTLLGDGTGVVVGVVDSGVDDTHPALTGLDSLSNPRMVAEANFVTYEANTGDDVFGHGTWVTSVVLSNDATYKGMAPDARYINARVLDAGNGFPNDVQVRNGIGFAIKPAANLPGADVLNISLSFFSPNSNGLTQLDLMLDYAAYAKKISSAIIVGNISTGSGSTMVRSPGSAYNGVTVGRTTADYSRVEPDSATAFTQDGRMKPDVVAPGTNLTMANDDWELGPLWDIGLSGTSFAAPHVAGMMAQEIEAGRSRGWSTDPLVIKSTIMNSADKVLDKGGNPWAPATASTFAGVFTASQPLDTDSGAGQINGHTLAAQYLAGEKVPGVVTPIGWDLGNVGNGQFVDYMINPNLLLGSKLTATLTWNRHVGWTDNGNNMLDANDFFSELQPINNLDLQILRNGVLIAKSVSSVDNLEHLNIDVDQVGQYTLRVAGQSVLGGLEDFGLAWYSTAVPEPTSLVLAILAVVGLPLSRRRR